MSRFTADEYRLWIARETDLEGQDDPCFAVEAETTIGTDPEMLLVRVGGADVLCTPVPRRLEDLREKIPSGLHLSTEHLRVRIATLLGMQQPLHALVRKVEEDGLTAQAVRAALFANVQEATVADIALFLREECARMAPTVLSAHPRRLEMTRDTQND